MNEGWDKSTETISLCFIHKPYVGKIMAHLVRCISEDGSLLIMAVDTTDIVSDAVSIHKTNNVCSAALGRMLTGATMMGSMLKGKNDSLTLRINGGGPCGSIIAVSDSSCHVKGYISDGNIDLPLNDKGKLDVGGAVGTNGFLTVIKDLGLNEPYIGQVPIVSGEIAEDITQYFAISEQTPSVCGLGVLMNPDNTVAVSGGFLIQLLPTVIDSDIDKVENDIQNIQSVTQMMAQGLSPFEICKKVLPSFNIQQLDEYYPVYQCDCSKDKVQKALISVGREGLTEMAEENQTEVECHFCDKKYLFSQNDIKQILKNS